MAACQSTCEGLISPLGFPREHHPFHPHLTIARSGDPRRSRAIREALASAGNPDLGMQCVDHLTFYLSTPSAKGSLYQPLSKHDFS